MQIVRIILLLALVCFGDEYYTVRADGSGNYLTPQQCEDAGTKDYTGVGIFTCDVTQAGTYSGNTTIAGQTNTDANNRFMLKSSLALGLVTLTASAGTYTVNLNSLYSEVCCLKIKATGAVTAVLGVNRSPSYSSKLILEAGATGIYGLGMGDVDAGSPTTYSIAIYCSVAGNTVAGLFVSNNAAANYYNISSIGFNESFKIFTGSITATNCIGIKKSGGTADFGTTGFTISYSLSSDATATGTGSLINKTFAETMASDSVHIATTSVAYGVGTNLLAQGVLTDIDNVAWTNWSMGADDPTPTSRRRCSILWRNGLAPYGR